MKKILIIDDNYLITQTLASLLNSYEYETHEAIGGAEGLSRYFEVNPDVVITDIEMPFVPGEIVIEKIKQHNKEQIIIAMSATETKRKIAIDAGATAFCLKPLFYEDIMTYLKQQSD